ncbi:ectoine/hydroxyectoine ABC transporter permease subunit EhuC [Acidihalobacter prosperus]|uniref:Ectoine/hydroxyectoine ABC transporter permease subunit EhuC n=1 Tax=Acidihalobacter prosperus TaxID=160660 RepID=A0A1A6C5W2_9GAMM|nr:ectoine/hydroxyectoine ABC transporter permease subunit EhuC [Acidihalobacter prosperus]OBS09949.1 ectoine/hydroxyectoine ABC transporter permease subunit EhuC [Acidihalobacter prosperus]
MTFTQIALNVAQGLQMTVELTLLSSVLGVLIAFVFGTLKTVQWRPVRYFATAYVEIFRGTSLIVQLFWLYYALPLLGLSLSPFVAGIAALSLNIGAYGAEVVRGALQAVPRGQREAAIALGFTPAQRIYRIFYPQALPEMMPTFGNLAVQNLKDSSVVSLISLADLTYYANNLQNLTFETTRIYTVTLFAYFGLALLLSWAIRGLENRLRRWKTRK